MARPDQGYSLAQLLTRGGVEYEHLDRLAPAPEAVPPRAREQLAIQIKYAGYIERQLSLIERQNQWEALLLPDDFDYHAVRSLSREAQARLSETRPRTVGQAGRVSGVTPSDMEVLCIHLRARSPMA